MEQINSPLLIDWLNLTVDLLTPIAVVLLGILAKKYADTLRRHSELNDIRTQWRLEVARPLLGDLNVLRQFFTYVGDWRSIDVERATAAKRNIDRLIYSNIFLWSKNFLAKWEALKAAAFEENIGPGVDFKFRANVDRHRENSWFNESCAARFVSPSARVTRQNFLGLYDPLVAQAVRDIGIISE